MSILKYNKVTPKYDYQIPEGSTFATLKELYKVSPKATHEIKGFYINTKSKYGDSPVVITDTNLVNLPSHKLEQVKEMMLDEELTNGINAGLYGFTIYEYEKDNSKHYSINWVEIKK